MFTAKVKSHFSVQHLSAAARFSHQCGTIQQANQGQPFGPFYEELIELTSASVMLSVAAMEAYINELRSEPDRLYPEHPEDIRRQFFDETSRKPTLDKYDFVLQ